MLCIKAGRQRFLALVATMLILFLSGCVFHSFFSFLPERDYVMFGSFLSLIHLSSVCNVGASYSGSENSQQYFFTAVYPGHPLTSMQNVTEIPVGALNATGIEKYSDAGSIEGHISNRTR